MSPMCKILSFCQLMLALLFVFPAARWGADTWCLVMLGSQLTETVYDRASEMKIIALFFIGATTALFTVVQRKR